MLDSTTRKQSGNPILSQKKGKKLYRARDSFDSRNRTSVYRFQSGNAWRDWTRFNRFSQARNSIPSVTHPRHSWAAIPAFPLLLLFNGYVPDQSITLYPRDPRIFAVFWQTNHIPFALPATAWGLLLHGAKAPNKTLLALLALIVGPREFKSDTASTTNREDELGYPQCTESSQNRCQNPIRFVEHVSDGCHSRTGGVNDGTKQNPNNKQHDRRGPKSRQVLTVRWTDCCSLAWCPFRCRRAPAAAAVPFRSFSDIWGQRFGGFCTGPAPPARNHRCQAFRCRSDRATGYGRTLVGEGCGWKGVNEKSVRERVATSTASVKSGASQLSVVSKEVHAHTTTPCTTLPGTSIRRHLTWDNICHRRAAWYRVGEFHLTQLLQSAQELVECTAETNKTNSTQSATKHLRSP